VRAEAAMQAEVVASLAPEHLLTSGTLSYLSKQKEHDKAEVST